jgi:flagellar assembly protein FliH
MAVSHLSNLLKKNLDSEVPAFGFSAIQKGGEEKQVFDVEEQEPPDTSPEQLFRTKLLELERQTQEIEKEAYGKGFAQGERDGFEYGNKAAQVIKAQLERIAETMETMPGKVLSDYREWLIRTSMGIAERIINREVRISPQIVADIVKALVDEAEEHTTLTVYLNPNDFDLIEKKTDLALFADRKHCALKADKGLDRGGCRVESAIQLLDASLATKFENLEKYLVNSPDLPDEPGEADAS